MKTGIRKFNRSHSRRNSSSAFFNSNDASFFPVQHKLNVGQPGDKYEQEADRVADAVVQQNSPVTSPDAQLKADETIQGKSISENITPLVQHELADGVAKADPKKEEEKNIQRQPEEEEEPIQMQVEEEEEPIQMKEEEEEMQLQSEEDKKEEELMAKAEGQANAAPSVESTLQANTSTGNQIDNETQGEMENSFGADFSQVRIHTDRDAIRMNKQMGSQAFTHGKDIYFNENKYNPQSEEGRHLLAHELTHTVQQTGFVSPGLQFTIGDNRDLVADRFSGNTALEACLDGERTLRYGSTGRPVSLIQRALVDAGFPLPVYGVDGIFKSETQGAVENFQRSSSLPVTGMIDAKTMSSLDGLFSWGNPSLPTGTPGTVAPTITSETISIAPDGTADNRTLVGVGEFVRFTGNTEGTWSATSGRIIGLNTGHNMVWEAPPTVSVTLITLTNQAGTATMIMTTIPPNGIALRRANILPVPAGTLGAAMEADITVLPMNVNFGRTQWLEQPGPATNVTGYFTRFSVADLFHKPNKNYLPFDDMNTGLIDEAAWRGGNPPFSNGYHEWVIPNKYKIDGESDAQGRIFTNVTQSFFVTSAGDTMVLKAGAFVYRTLSNIVI